MTQIEKPRFPVQIKDRDTVAKMTMIASNLMDGSPILAAIDWGEEALGHNAILAGFQEQQQ